MRRLRTLALAALLTSLSLGPSPASAEPLGVGFVGFVHIDCFGCGVPSACQVDLILLGTHTGTATTTPCTATELPGALCLVTGSAFGTITGTGAATGLSLDFTWTRIGAALIITISGDSTGVGTAQIIDPPTRCGGPVDFTIVGSLSGV